MTKVYIYTSFLHRSEGEGETESVVAEPESDTPVYELPPEKYSAEDIVQILLSPNIDRAKICKKRPCGVCTSASYVVDLDSLQHPDDVKDNFGVWKHSGSHDLKFETRINSSGELEIGRSLLSSSDGWEQFSLRRLHSKHPTNPNFGCILSFITGMIP